MQMHTHILPLVRDVSLCRGFMIGRCLGRIGCPLFTRTGLCAWVRDIPESDLQVEFGDELAEAVSESPTSMPRSPGL